MNVENNNINIHIEDVNDNDEINNVIDNLIVININNNNNENQNEDDDDFDNMPALVDNFAPIPEHVPPWDIRSNNHNQEFTPQCPTSIEDHYNCLLTLQTNCNIKSVQMINHQIIFDSGASTCATSDVSIIKDIIHGEGVKATPAFGPPITSTASGTYGPLDLDIILMEGMQETLVSVSQLCQGGQSNCQNIVIFTSEGMRCFTLESSRTALQLIDKVGQEVIRGYISNGVYVHDPTRHSRQTDIKQVNSNNNVSNNILNPSVFLAQFKPVSLYDHIHMVTGHPGNAGMDWHLKNSTNAKYTEEDATRQRGTCKGCVYGTMRQTSTDHHREHRNIPLKPGQCFTLDAYTHTVQSSRGFKYCDIYTNLATRRCCQTT